MENKMTTIRNEITTMENKILAAVDEKMKT
jgi:hypothetical protein